MKVFNILLLLIFFTNTVFADLTIPPKSVEKQYLYNAPINVNSGFEQGLTGWTVSEASTMVLQTALSNIHSGARSISWNPSVAGTLTSGTFTPNANLGGMLTVECYIKTADADYDLQLYDTTAAAAVQTMDIVTDGADSAFSLNKFVYPMSPSATTRTFQIRLNAPGNESVMYADDCRMYFDSSAIPVNVNQVYSAKISSADAVTHENEDWINGNCTDATTGEQTCTFTTGFFTQTPNCWATNSDVNSNNDITISAISATAVTVFSSGNGTPSDRASILSCQRSEPSSGFAVRMDQTNYGWTTYTPTFTGFGSPTGVSFRHRRRGENLEISGTFTSGTPTATEARVSLPTGLTTSSSVTTVEIGNIWVRNISNANKGGILISEPSVSYFTFGTQNTFGTDAGTPMTKVLGNAMIASGQAVYVNYTVPISGWTENQSAPLIVNGVTSTYGGTLRIESAKVATTGTVSQEYGDWVSGNCTNASPQVCTLNSGVFSAIPNCWMNNMDTGSTTNCFGEATSTTNVNIKCSNDGGSVTTTSVNKTLYCVGPR